MGLAFLPWAAFGEIVSEVSGRSGCLPVGEGLCAFPFVEKSPVVNPRVGSARPWGFQSGRGRSPTVGNVRGERAKSPFETGLFGAIF